MAVQVPTPDQLRAIADEMRLSLTGEDVESFINLMRPSVAAYNVVDAMPDNLPTVKYPRTPGYRPSSERNEVRRAYNAAEWMPDRRRMMQWWADHITAMVPESNKIVPLLRAS
jgi:hypothetical protein